MLSRFADCFLTHQIRVMFFFFCVGLCVCAGRDLIRCYMGKNSKDCDMSLMIQFVYL